MKDHAPGYVEKTAINADRACRGDVLQSSNGYDNEKDGHQDTEDAHSMPFLRAPVRQVH